jgi:hypothetical protein
MEEPDHNMISRKGSPNGLPDHSGFRPANFTRSITCHSAKQKVCGSGSAARQPASPLGYELQ